jgi:hypothetical protein
MSETTAERTDTERLDWLDRDNGWTVYPHESFEGRPWAFKDHAFTFLRGAIDAAMDYAAGVPHD